jgi:hypothetical protein
LLVASHATPTGTSAADVAEMLSADEAAAPVPATVVTACELASTRWTTRDMTSAAYRLPTVSNAMCVSPPKEALGAIGVVMFVARDNTHKASP